MTNNQVAVKTTGDFLTNPQLLNAKIVKQYLDPSGKASDEELAYLSQLVKNAISIHLLKRFTLSSTERTQRKWSCQKMPL